MSDIQHLKDILQELRGKLSSSEDIEKIDEAISIADGITTTISSTSKSIALSWQMDEVLSIFKRFSAVPGQSLSPQAISSAWGARPINDMWQGLDDLEKGGLIDRNAAQTEYVLTQSGYDALK